MTNTITGASTASFLEARFPTNISWGAVGGCAWSTRTVKLDSGWVYRRAYYALDRGRWTITHKFRNAAEWAALIAFFRNDSGRLRGFRFQDPTDYTYETYLGSGVSAGVVLTNPAGQLQFYKAYTLTDVNGNNQVANRPIFKPAPDQPVTITSPDGMTTRNGWTLNCSTGVVTGGGVLANDVWTGQFDIPVRFDTDRMDLIYEFYNNTTNKGGVSWQGIPVVELVEPFTTTVSAGGPQTISGLKTYGMLSTRWHVDGAAANPVGSFTGPFSTVTTTYSNYGNVGGYVEPSGVQDLLFVACVYERSDGRSASVSSISDNYGGHTTFYTPRKHLTLTIPNAVPQGGGAAVNVKLNFDLFVRPSLVTNPWTITTTVNFVGGLDSAVVAPFAISGLPNYPATVFDADTPFSTSAVVGAGLNATPTLAGLNTASLRPIVFGFSATLQGNGGGHAVPVSVASPGGWDSNDFTDGGFGNAPGTITWSAITENHSGVSTYLVELFGFFSQSTGQLSSATVTLGTFTAAAGSPGGYITYLDALSS